MTTVACDRPTSVTKSLLGYGVIAGPFYFIVSLAQALTRDGFDLTRHEWSLLANGSLGWVQIANFILTGAMVLAFAVGLRRALRSKVAWLIGVFGVGLIGGGVFRADPALGFPPGTPDGPGAVSWHGLLHFVCAGVGFLCLIVACLTLARRFAAEGDRRWAAFSAVTGVAFLAAFAGVATGTGGAAGTAVIFAFIAAVALAFGWIAALAVRLYRNA